LRKCMQNKPVRLFAGLSVLALVLYLVFGIAPGISSARVASQRGLPPNQPELGLIYDGLEVATSGQCAGMYQVRGTDLCTHGPDPIPPGAKADQDVPPPPAMTEQQPTNAVCDGQIGYRVQVMYLRAADKPDRFDQYRDLVRQWAMEADHIFQTSAMKTGGTRHVRYVLNNDCSLSVLNVVLSSAGDDSFNNTVNELKALGYERRDRKYMIFFDDNTYCGVATRYRIDHFGQLNANNFGPSYGFTGNRCWHTAGSIAAHELMHNLGAVQNSAPNSDLNGHCVDRQEVMCSHIVPGYPEACPTAHHYLFDCNNDDYYHTNPPADSYLTDYWNSANNQFLIGAATPTPFPPRGRNLALFKPATADSSCLSSEGPDKAVNGSVSGGLSDKWCSVGANRWMQVDLGQMATITGFTLKHSGAGGERTAWNTWEYTIQLSSDGIN
jgi:hypothetical protein